ncbi:MAG: ZIP family metal transporter [Anaerolineales bacterium]
MSKGEAEITAKPTRRIPLWLSALLPFLALALMLSVFAFGNPLAFFTADLPPVEILTFEPVRVVPEGFEVTLINAGPDAINVAQVLVDDAYWEYTIDPSRTIPRLGRAELQIPYPWVETEPHQIMVITATGLTFTAEVAIATPTPTAGIREFLAYGLLGFYVGVIPVALGTLWFPAMRRLGQRWMGAILALTLGLLVFLLTDTLLEAFEIAARLPAVFQGVALVLFSALLTWFALLAVRSRGGRLSKRGLHPGLVLSILIALGIGLHNLGEGLAIGAAFALGEAALGSFLVIGFTIHNVTEGIAIAAPLVPGAVEEDYEATDERPAKAPGVWTFVGLILLAGAPAIPGTWIGGFAYSPVLATIFLGIGAGAIWQVIVEVGEFLRRYAQREHQSVVTWPNVGGFLLGLGIMYLTAFLVSF